MMRSSASADEDDQPALLGDRNGFRPIRHAYPREQLRQSGLDLIQAEAEASGYLTDVRAAGQKLKSLPIPRRDLQHRRPPIASCRAERTRPKGCDVSHRLPVHTSTL